LGTLVAPTKQYDGSLSVASEVNAVSRADVYPKLSHAFADRLAIAKIGRGDSLQANPDSGGGGLVAQAIELNSERFGAVFALISKQLHRQVCRL
jgi:hypothetical protein